MELDIERLEKVFKEVDWIGKRYVEVSMLVNEKVKQEYGRVHCIPIMEYPDYQLYVGILNKGYWRFKFRNGKLHSYGWNIPSCVIMNKE